MYYKGLFKRSPRMFWYSFKRNFLNPKRYKNWFKFLWQRWTRGWDDSECWNLDYSLAKMIAPRLRRFKETKNGWNPSDMTVEEWETILDKMIAAFEYYGSDERWGGNEFEMCELHQEGIDLFAKYYGRLWT